MLASYLTALSPTTFSKAISGLSDLVRKKFPKANLIFGRGISGVAVIPTLGSKLKMDWAIIRKGESTHSHKKVECTRDLIAYAEDKSAIVAVFVDDFCCTGLTFRESARQLKEACSDANISVTIAGIVTYDDPRSDPFVSIIVNQEEKVPHFTIKW